MDLQGNIHVFCRVLPSTDMSHIKYPQGLERKGRGVDIDNQPFTFDRTFDHDASQDQVFEEVSPYVQFAIDGNKVCIFAYGYTGSGKTCTMVGRGDGDRNYIGIVPRAMKKIFDYIQLKSSNDPNYRCEVQAGMVEIYNESIVDLFSTGDTSQIHTINHSTNGLERVVGLTIADCPTCEEIYSRFTEATVRRHSRPTESNQISSRSHLVCILEISEIDGSNTNKSKGILNLIDLAGSESTDKSGVTDDGLNEATKINKSLSQLKTVMKQLAENKPYLSCRGFQLTDLLNLSIQVLSYTLRKRSNSM